MWLLLSCIGSSAPDPIDAPPAGEGDPHAAVGTSEAPPPPSAPPTGRAVVFWKESVSYSGVAWAPAVDGSMEVARQEAHACFARDPSFQGDVAIDLTVDATGTVSGVNVSDAASKPPPVGLRPPLTGPLASCLVTAITKVPFPAASGELPMLSVHATWTFAVVPELDPDHACIRDAECGLVTGMCAPQAVNVGHKDLDAAGRTAAATASCTGLNGPVFARCQDGACGIVAGDMTDMRDCKVDADCEVFERKCGWDAVAVSRAKEGRSIVEPENSAVACAGPLTRPPAPVARCAMGFCTAQWIGQ